MLRHRTRLRQLRFRSKLVRRPVVIYRHRGLKQKDVFLATYPRSGTTWMRFLLYEAISGNPAEFGSVAEGIPYIGKHEMAPRLIHGGSRLIQTHEKLCDSNRDVIYMVRDPRNVVVSQFHHYVRRKDNVIPNNFDAFFDGWLSGKFVPFGRWDEHVEFWLEAPRRKGGRIQVIRYEDLRREPIRTLRTALAFLGYSLSDETLAAIVENNTMQRMQEKEDKHFAKWRASSGDRRFIRSGTVGNWKESLSEAQESRLVDNFRATLRRVGYEASP